MSFRVRKPAYRPWPVTITLQECDANGQVAEAEQAFIGHFTNFSEADLLAARRDIFGDESASANTARLGAMPVAEHAALEAQFFARLMCGWDKVADADGAPLAYSAEALAALVTGPDGPPIRRALNGALMQIRFGLAPAKNAATSPSPGPTPGAGEAAPTS